MKVLFLLKIIPDLLLFPKSGTIFIVKNIINGRNEQPMKTFYFIFAFLISFHDLFASDRSFVNSYVSFIYPVSLTSKQQGDIRAIKARIDDGEILEMTVSTAPNQQIYIEIRDVSWCCCFFREVTTLTYDESVATQFISQFLEEEDVILKGIDCLTDLDLPYIKGVIPKNDPHG